MAQQIKPGDVVQLKSGGPKMTVKVIKTVAGKESAYCTWFVNDEAKEYPFPLETLKPAN